MLFEGIRRRTRRTHASLDKLVREYNRTRSFRARKRLCYLPYSQLYLSFGGNVFVCCGNRSYLLGKYPDQSLKEIWFGERLRGLREAIERRDLTKGCEVCLEQLQNRNYRLVLARLYDPYARFLREYPVSVELELSNTCNLDCIMCSGEFSSTAARRCDPGYQSPPSPYDGEFVREFEAFIPHLKEVSFKGGEPFLIKTYTEIWERILDINPSILLRIITNATAYNDRFRELLERSNFYLNVSLDSLRKERYESIRRNARFESTMENLRRMMDLNRRKGSGRLTIMVCFMNVNWDEMPELVNFCNEHRVGILFLHITYPARYLSVRHAGPKTMAYIHKTLASVELPSTNAYQAYNRESYKQLLTQIGTWRSEADRRSPGEALHTFKGTLENYLKERCFELLCKTEKGLRVETVLGSFDSLVEYGTTVEHRFVEKLIEMPADKLADSLMLNKSPDEVYASVGDHVDGLQARIRG